VAIVTARPSVAPSPDSTDSERNFDEFYAMGFPILSSQLYAYLGDRAEAQDVVQEAYCRAYSKWQTIGRYQDPHAWVRRVAWNLATSRFRRQKTAWNFLRRQREEYAAGPSPDRVALITALSNIPAQLRKALVLHYIGELNVAEIADQEDVAEGTVKSWLSRGRAALGEQLNDFQAAGALGSKPDDGPVKVRVTVARRRKVKVAALTIVIVLAIVVPVLAFGARPNGHNLPPGESPSPTAPASASTTPAPTPESSDSLAAAIVAAQPAIPSGVACPSAQGGWRSSEKGGKPLSDAVVDKAVNVNVDSDPELEVAAKVFCLGPTGGSFGDYVVVFDSAAGTLRTLAVVTKAGPDERIEDVLADGDRIAVLLAAANYPGSQLRKFKWSGTAFIQAEGPTAFPTQSNNPLPSTDLALTVSDMTVTDVGTCQFVDGHMTLERKGTIQVTVRNLGVNESGPFRVFLDGDRATYPIQVDAPSWVSTKYQAQEQTHGGIKPGETVTLTVAMSTATCFAGWPVDATLVTDDLNLNNNKAMPKL
jgi:RNA polymerase sigma-70 factor (ECF subfamily)